MKRKMTTLVMTAMLLMLPDSVIPGAPAAAAVQASVYASPSGSGNTCTLAAPCSLAGAKTKVQSLNANMSGDIIVYLRGGTYTLSAPLTFSSADSGTNGHRVIYRRYQNETPLISGGVNLTGGWELHDTAANIYRKNNVSQRFRQLVVEGQSGIRARTPNRTDANDFGPYYTVVAADTANRTYTVNRSEIGDWDNLMQVEMVVQPHWYHNNLRVASYVADSDYAYLTFRSPENATAFFKEPSFYNAGSAYHFENAYELLDAPGEWYHNTSTDTLYYKPRSGENMGEAAVTATGTEVLFDLAGTPESPVRNLSFDGLVFRHAGWNGPSNSGAVLTQAVQPAILTTNGYAKSAYPPGAVRVEYADHIRLQNSRFEQLGGNGIVFFRGVKHSEIVGNQFQDIAANGVVLDGYARKLPTDAEQTRNIVVGNNTITRFGQAYTNGIGILAGFVRQVTIEHNEISYGPYSGMQIGNQSSSHNDIGAGDNIIRHNHVHRVMQLHDDGGGIYTLGRQEGTRIVQNWVHHISRSSHAQHYPIGAFYLDNYSEFITLDHNVTHDLGSTVQQIFEQVTIGARNNVKLNNNTQSQDVKDRAGPQIDYIESGFNLANGSALSSDSGWTNLHYMWDDNVSSFEATAAAAEAWVEYDFVTPRTITKLVFQEDNHGDYQTSDWKVQHWDGSSFVDSFLYQPSATGNLQEKTVFIQTSKLRLLVRNTAPGGLIGVKEFRALGGANLASSATHSGNSGWSQLPLLWDGTTSGEAYGSSSPAWVEFDLGAQTRLSKFRFNEDNDGTYQATQWHVQVWNGSAFVDAFSPIATHTNTWQEQEVDLTTSRLRLYVVNSNPGGIPAVREFQILP
ncbi:right-handed parallel beta-helix repeat-containing protein [Paenibacillus sp. 1P07SE]|uniref:right-handed parallel beta-helix repeat-containing protein n=1 Tax=Paenibacillus sp. 1P07SE TaxID=3132209 RepID=UPI0039A551E4